MVKILRIGGDDAAVAAIEQDSLNLLYIKMVWDAGFPRKR